MSPVCGRCKEKEVVFECADCVASKRRGELLPLCDGCNDLIHVGFLEEHQVVSVTIKEQKLEFEKQLENFKRQGKHLQLKLKEITYAKQDIEQRAQYNKQAVTQAFQALWQALKQKEQELSTPLKDQGKTKAAQLAECEGNISKVAADFQALCSEAQKVLQGNSVEFAQQYEEMAKKLEDFQIDPVPAQFPMLGCPARLDVTGILQAVGNLRLPAAEDDREDSAPKADTAQESDSAQDGGQKEAAVGDLQAPKQGDCLQVYVESRIDARGHFWISRFLSEDTANVYEDLSFKIRQDFIQTPASQAEIVEGMLCCGQYQEDHRWYRGRVEKVNKEKGLARVRWLDYAHDNEVPLSSVQPLKEEFQTVPFQALECCLFQDLQEDLPHQARWEFSDHTANALLSCTILGLMPTSSPEDKTPVYLVKLKNPSKDLDVKEKVQEKVDESKQGTDTIMCRDIRYMKDYVPPPNKSTATAKKEETTEAQDKDRTDCDDKDSPKQATKGEETGVDGRNGTEEKKDGEGKDEAGQGRDTNQDDGEKKKEDAEATSGGCGGGEEGSNKTASSNAEAGPNGRPDQETNRDANGIPDGQPESQQQTVSNNGSTSKSSQNGHSRDADEGKVSSVTDAGGVYSVEPDGDEEEADDQGLVELLARRGDRAMAHSPDNTLAERAAGYDGSGPRLYSGAPAGAYHSSMGPGGHRGPQYPPGALGLNPIQPASNPINASTKSDQSSSTFLASDSSLSVCIATPLSDKGRFWATRVRGPAQESQLRRIMYDISLPSEPLTLDRLKEIKLVCAQAESGEWCRAKVEGFQEGKVQVRYMDFGVSELVEECRIKALPVGHQFFPFQASELSVATAQHTHFSDKAKEAFWKYTQGRTLIAKVIADEAKITYVTLYCMDENQLMYDISAAVLNVNAESLPSSSTEDRGKDKHVARESHRGNQEEQNGGGQPCDDYRYADNQDVRYDQQSEGRQSDRAGGDRCFVCNNYGHLSYDCPSKGRDPRDRNDRNYRNKGGQKKQQGWGRRNRKY